MYDEINNKDFMELYHMYNFYKVNEEENQDIVYGIGDPCLIKAIVTSRNCYNKRTKNELIMHVKSMYFRKTQGCKFDVDLTLAEK